MTFTLLNRVRRTAIASTREAQKMIGSLVSSTGSLCGAQDLHSHRLVTPSPYSRLVASPHFHAVLYNNDPLRQKPRLCVAAQRLRSQGLSSLSLRESNFHGGRHLPVLGFNLPEVWTSRNDLQPCHAILEEDLTKFEPKAILIDGKAVAQKLRQEIAEEITRVKVETGKVPGLAVVLVGTRKDSETYVRSKKKACEEVGIASFGVNLPEDCSEAEVLKHVKAFNEDPSVHGILVQLPLPKHMNEERVLAAVTVDKDVDGFHPLNIGKLAMQGREPLFVPCTPRGCIELLLRSNVEIKGKHAVVIGRSNVVGSPAAMLLQRHQATVTVIHSYTPNPAEVTRRADIVIAAVGVAHLVRGDWIKPGAVVIDVGINAIEDSSAKKGYRLVGDVCFQEASMKASAITPVPGGVGPMTIAMLLSNTLESAKRAYGLLD